MSPVRPPTINPGEMRTQVAFQQNTPTQDAEGATVDSWVTQFTLWAKIQHRRGGEQDGADRYVQRYNEIVMVHYHPTLAAADTETWRMLIDGEPVNIIDIENPRRANRYLFITGVAGEAARNA